MRIVIATPFYPPQSGVLATYAAGLEEAFEKTGHTVMIVKSGRGPVGVRHIFFFFRIFFALSRASFVLSLDTWSVGLPALFAARLRRVPFSVRIGGDFLWEQYVERTHETIRLSEFYTAPRKYSWKEHIIFRGTRYLLAHAEALFFTTRFQKKIWQEAYGFSSERSGIIENYFPGVAGAYLPATSLMLVSAGRPIGLKNIELLQRVVQRLTTAHPGLSLDGRLLPRQEHLKRIAASYAVIIPSLSEVCSNTAIDAVSLGKPFICTEDTGTSERLAECGIFIDTRSEASIEQAIESILDPQTYERLAANARTFSFTHSWDQIANEVLAGIAK